MKKIIYIIAILFSVTVCHAQKPVLHYDFKASKNEIVVNKANKK